MNVRAKNVCLVGCLLHGLGCGARADTTGPAPTTDAATADTPGSDQPVSLAFGGGTREAILHVPAGYQASRTYPLLVVYHGLGGTGAGIERVTGFDSVADAKGFFVVYPESRGGQWSPPGPNGDIAFSEALLASLEEKFPVDSSHVYSAGFSEGGGMSQAMACAYTNRLAGAADVSENLSPRFQAACEPAAPITFVLFHGTADPVSPFDGGAGSIAGVGGKHTESALTTAEFWANVDGCSAHPQETTREDLLSDGEHVTDVVRSWSGCKSGTSVTFYTITGGGHAWPGGSSSNMEVGPSSRNIDASSVIWSLLGGHSR